MQLTNIELAAVLKLGSDMLMADGKIHENETAVLTIEVMKFGVTPEKLEHLLKLAKAMDPVEAIATVESFDNEEKKHVTSFLAAVMASDGEIADSELALWNLVSGLASLPTMTVQEGIDYWKNQ